MDRIGEHLEEASAGRGSTVFISGEAGIGKTRLLEEIRNLAKSKGFLILWGNSLYESLTPYMPFLEALRSGGLELFFAEEVPKVEAVYLVTSSGLLVKDIVKKESRLDSHIFGSMLTAVGEFVKDSLTLLEGEKTERDLNRLDYGEYTILIESSSIANLAVIMKGRENEFLINDMKEILLDVGKEFGSVLKDWDGKHSSVQGIEQILQPLISSGKYDGIYYGLEDPKARRNLLFENVSLGLVRQAETTPTLLCIEDLHWADPSSLALMHYVARNTRKSSLLIMGTYRPEEITARVGRAHPLVETMQLMDRENLCKKMELRRLPKETIGDFLHALLGEMDFTDKFMGRIYKETEGNPLFAIELVRLLVDEEIIKMEDGDWRLNRDIEDVDIPSKIYDVIVRRLDRLEEEEREILDYAAVVGVEFTSNILESAKNINKIELLKHLRKLEQKHRLIHSFNGEYRFDHAKIKEVLYNEIPFELRMEYHSVIANSIETLNKDNLEKVIGNLAFHYYHCRNKEKALHYLNRAAKKAEKEFSNNEIIRFHTEALEFDEDKQQRYKTLMSLGDTYGKIGAYDKSMESYTRALEFSDEKEERCDAFAGIGRVHLDKGETKEALETIKRALDLIGGKDCIQKANVLRIIGIIYMITGDHDNALKYTEMALEASQKISDQVGIAGALNNIGIIWDYRGEYDRALSSYEKALDISEKVGFLDYIGRHLGSISILNIQIGKLDEGLSYNERSLEIANKIGNQKNISLALMNRGWAYFKKGDYDKALEIFEKSLEISRKINDLSILSRNMSNIARVHLEKKDFQRSLDFCNQAYNLSRNIGLKDVTGESSRTFGMIYLEQKQWKQSIESFEQSIRIFEEIQHQRMLAESRFEYGMMWKAKGDLDKAREQLGIAKDIYAKIKLKAELEKVDKVLSDFEKIKQ